MPLFDLSDRVKLRVRGNDRLRFLNGQVTNDVRKANRNLSLPACVLSAKGRLEAFIYISAEAETFLLDADPELQETLQPRLERYLIADDAVIEDVSEELALFHLLRETPLLPDDYEWLRSKRFGRSGWDLFAPAAERDRLRQVLAAEEVLLDPESTEQFRIEQGIPRWGRELTGEIIPIEANLEAEAIDYAKGCYIGQEVISRMKISGQTNKRLCGLISVHDAPLVSGLRLTTMGAESKEVGWITSAIRSRRLEKEIALGFVKRGYNSIWNLESGERRGPDLDALAKENPFGSPLVRVRVVPLPFVRDQD
jgi:tRNA-modifying protein YgfZ